jgi:hypothetical protein
VALSRIQSSLSGRSLGPWQNKRPQRGVALEPFGLVVPSDHAGGVRGYSSLGTYSTHPLVLRSIPLVGICGPQPPLLRRRFFLLSVRSLVLIGLCALAERLVRLWRHAKHPPQHVISFFRGLGLLHRFSGRRVFDRRILGLLRFISSCVLGGTRRSAPISRFALPNTPFWTFAMSDPFKKYDFNPHNLPQNLQAAIGLMTACAAQTESIVEMAIAGCLGVDSEYGQRSLKDD